MTLAATPTTAMLDTIADALEAAWDDLVCGLYTNSPPPEPTQLYADMTQPTFTGYLRAAMTIGARRGNANGDIIEPLGMATFQPTAGTAFIANNATTPVLQLFEDLDTPWQVVDTGSALDIIWEAYVKADPVYGGICSTCSS